jgi:glycosyltransferase involved in cell wall biosynthesis
VLVVQERLPHYRVPFFEQLRSRLDADGIDLAVVHGRGRGAMAARGDEAELSWARVLDNRVVSAGGHSLVWQPVYRLAAGADLVIVEQASRMAVNYALLARQARGGPRIAFWGHGANLQTDRSWVSRLSEAAKSRYSRLPHWWFAYTEGSARRVEALGFPHERITVVQNAVDTSLIEATEVERDPLRCIFVGSLFPAKRLDLVFAAADLVAADIPGFRLVVVGDGEQRGYVEHAAANRPYADYIGPKFGKDLAKELKQSSLMLMPGHVGLGVLDAFAAGLPVVTALGMAHSPEFEYLEDGVNGLVAEPTGAALAAAVRRVLEPAFRSGLGLGGSVPTRRYTIEQMTQNFESGIWSALEAP